MLIGINICMCNRGMKYSLGLVLSLLLDGQGIQFILYQTCRHLFVFY